MITTKMLLASSLMALALPAVAGAQQTPPTGCSEAVHDDFDFWVGQWNVYAPGGGAYQGQNSIVKTHGGCLVTEHWTGAGGSTGQSMNFHDPLVGAWRQVWVSQSSFIDYTGGLNADGAMVLTGEIHNVANGSRAPFTGVWTPLEDGSVRQHFRQSDAEGNWSDWFVGIYVRQENDPRAAEAAAARGE
ncbi:hypothetical protein [Maricaulis sp.]|uniref:hypothetical protein n=1 Tax=Maricaulis sp. TaxID=1486257 RepID=UPI003A9588A7